MAKKVKDKDYLYTSARVRAMEHSLLNRSRMERMMKARNPMEAARVLTECGYPELPAVTQEAVDTVIAQQRAQTYDLLGTIAPDASVLDVFRLKYDYHNAKVLLKTSVTGENANRLLMDMGRVPAKTLAESILQRDLRQVPPLFRTAIEEALETLRTTGDPQRTDIMLDRAYFDEMGALARQANSDFLQGYVRISIDASNLRSAVRAQRMGKSPDFLRIILFSGGNISRNRIFSGLATGSTLDALYAASPLKEAAEEGVAAGKGHKPLTRFETLCDNAVSRYLRSAKYNSISEAPLICYLGAKETELTAVRILMAGQMAGLAPEVLQERLREIDA